MCSGIEAALGSCSVSMVTKDQRAYVKGQRSLRDSSGRRLLANVWEHSLELNISAADKSGGTIYLDTLVGLR